jgi:hypothetical protein
VDIATVKDLYGKEIVPVGAVTSIRYVPDRRQKQKKQEKRQPSFKMMLDAQMKESPMDENQSFQLYC